jgi:excisionase family DNA binding protein
MASNNNNETEMLTTMNHNLCYRPEEVRQLLGVGEKKLRTLAKSGQIPAIKLGSTFRYSKAMIDRFIAGTTA